MGPWRRARSRDDDPRRVCALHPFHQLSAVALALFVLACHDTTTIPIHFQVTDVQASCQLRKCEQITLQCISKVRATLLPDGGPPIVGECMDSSKVATTLCNPTKLFPKPMFDQLDEQKIGLRIEGFYAGANCNTALAFTAETKAPFDLAQAAASNMPVEMTASCPPQRLNPCDPVLNLQAEMVGWPPDAMRSPPAVSNPSYNIDFGYVLSDMQVPPNLVFKSLFPVNYQFIDNRVSGTGVYTDEARSDADRCIGYQTTLLPAGGTVTTQSCIDKSLLVGTIQPIDAFFVVPALAAAIGRAQPMGLDINNGVLLGQVRHNVVGRDGAVVSVQAFGGGDASSRLFYLDDSGNFVQGTMTFNNPDPRYAGVFAIAGLPSGPSLVQVSATWDTLGSPTLTRPILPRVATVFELDL